MNNELVYVLHTRNYRETSQLVDLFSRQAGRLRVVARGARGASRSKKASGATPLQAFQPFFATWRGKSDLKTLTSHETAATIVAPQGKALYIGFYVNELLTRLLPEHISHQDLFDRYARLVTLLSHDADPEPDLRSFELCLLDEMGYGVNFYTDNSKGEAIDPVFDYIFHPGEGFSKIDRRAGRSPGASFSGADLLAIADRQFESKLVRQSAKRLMRQALAPHLGTRPLYSRELFKQTLRESDNIS